MKKYYFTCNEKCMGFPCKIVVTESDATVVNTNAIVSRMHNICIHNKYTECLWLYQKVKHV